MFDTTIDLKMGMEPDDYRVSLFILRSYFEFYQQAMTVLLASKWIPFYNPHYLVDTPFGKAISLRGIWILLIRMYLCFFQDPMAISNHTNTYWPPASLKFYVYPLAFQSRFVTAFLYQIYRIRFWITQVLLKPGFMLRHSKRLVWTELIICSLNFSDMINKTTFELQFKIFCSIWIDSIWGDKSDRFFNQYIRFVVSQCCLITTCMFTSALFSNERQ